LKLPFMDLHVHSEYSHGKGSIQDIIKVGTTKNLDYLAITEHVRSQSSWFASFLSDMEAVKKEKDIKVLSGIEAKVLDLDGKLDATERMIQAVDLVVASVHRIPSLHSMSGDLVVEKVDQDEAYVADLYIRALGGIASNPEVDVVGHPFHILEAVGVSRISRDRKVEIAKLFSASEKAVEVNSCYHAPDLEFLRICLKEGVKISVGSDAHRLEVVGNVKWSMRLLKKAGGTAEDIIDVDSILTRKT
jgi:putative hydrolase